VSKSLTIIEVLAQKLKFLGLLFNRNNFAL